jgi:hypothetical protein
VYSAQVGQRSQVYLLVPRVQRTGGSFIQNPRWGTFIGFKK